MLADVVAGAAYRLAVLEVEVEDLGRADICVYLLVFKQMAQCFFIYAFLLEWKPLFYAALFLGLAMVF